MQFLGISERQKRALLHDEAVREQEKIVDLFQCVERLHELGTASMRKMVSKGTLLAVPRLDKALAFQVDLLELLERLPLHLMACALSQEPTKGGEWPGSVTTQALRSASWHGHVERGLQLLMQLIDMSSSLPPLEERAADPVFQQNVMDLVVLALVSAAGPDSADCLAAAGDGRRAQEALERASLVPVALRTLTLCALPGASALRHLSAAHLRDLGAAMLRQPRSPLLLDAVFDAVRMLYRMVRAALQASPSFPALPELAFQAGLAMEWLTELCCTPLFYHRLVLHDPTLAAPLRLIAAGLALHAEPFPPPPYGMDTASSLRATTQSYSTVKAKGAVELLAARCLALLRSLTDYQTHTFLDQACAAPATRNAAAAVAGRATFLAGLVLARPPTSVCPVRSPGEGQLAVNALQVLEVLADDSNFRGAAMRGIAAPAAAALSLPAEAFESAWCAGEGAEALHRVDFAIEGRPILLGPGSAEHLRRLDALALVLRREPGTNPDFARLSPATRARIQHVELEAAQRALALFQALGNAHCFDPARCHPTMQNAFANLLFAELQQAGSGAAGPSGASAAAQGARMLQAATGNLRRLHAYAQGIAAEAQRKGVAVVSLEDLALIDSLAQTLEDMAAYGSAQLLL